MGPRILFVSAADWAFRSNRLALAHSLVRGGASVGLICPPGDAVPELRDAGLRIFHMELSREKISFLQLVAAAKDVREAAYLFDADIVHCISLRCILLGWLALMGQSNKPSVVNHVIGIGSLYTETFKSVRHRILRRCVDWGLRRAIQSPGAKTVYQNRDDFGRWGDGGASEDETAICMPGSIDIEGSRTESEPLGPPWRLIYVGRLLQDKGVRELIEALGTLRSQGLSVTLSLCGDVDPGNPGSLTRAEVEALAQTSGFDWLGHRADVPQLISASHVLVLPTYREGLPRVLLEAGVAGRAVVTTDVPGCREVVVDGDSGLLVPPRNAEALALALRRILEDAELRALLAQGLRRRVESHFSDAVINPQWLRLYRAISSAR